MSERNYKEILSQFKRKERDSSSSECDTPDSTKHVSKRLNVDSIPTVPEARTMEASILSDIKDRLDSLQQTVVTKKDLDKMQTDLKSEMDKVFQAFVERIDELEARVATAERERDTLKTTVEEVKQTNGELFSKIHKHEQQINFLKKTQNDIEQQGRKWNLRVYNVAEVKPEDPAETSADCIKKSCQIFTDMMGVPVEESEVEVAHRVGARTRPAQDNGQRKAKPRPIILRFVSRKVRDRVLKERRALKGKGVSVGEDLTHMNFKLLKAAEDHSATLQAWSSNGKIIAKLKNGQTVRLDVDRDLDETLRKEINA
jgi:FtsZ-binding cell division protein ZapB